VIARARSKIVLTFGLMLLLSACVAPQTFPAQPRPSGLRAPGEVPFDPSGVLLPPLGADASIFFRSEYGPPDFVRQEIESQLWRYDGEDCALFLFLYLESESFVLRHAETDPPGLAGNIDTDCLSSIKNARAPSS
jgi:hypothetical protein